MWPLLALWNLGLSETVLYVTAIIFVFAFAKYYWNRNHYIVYTKEVTEGHSWCLTRLFSQPCFCNVCSSLLITTDGAFCDACGICADSACMKEADQTLPCKPTQLDTSVTTLKHHWVQGNLPLNSVCDICEEECGAEPGLTDFTCSYCQKTVHSDCRPNLGEVCDLGQFRKFILPPNCVKLKTVRGGRSIRKRTVVSEIRRPEGIANWTPLIVIGNRKSGNNDGGILLSGFRKLLNPIQVVDLADRNPTAALHWCPMVSGGRATVLVAGGDGTVGWTLNAIEKLDEEHRPPIAILPLGTGNDLSRVLDWGEGYIGEIDYGEFLHQISKASVVILDRWTVNIRPARHMGIRLPAKNFKMNNYLSIGVDALVTLNFHKTRESPFYLVSSRLLNKFIYFSYGTKDVLERECKNLDKKLTLWLDDNPVTLPEIEALVVLNIPCWGAGVRPWTLGPGGAEAPEQSLSDGILEVFCVYSSFHVAQLQVGLSEPLRIGTAHSVKLVLSEPAPMQIDGEPWEQPPGAITITHHGQCSMLQAAKEE